MSCQVFLPQNLTNTHEEEEIPGMGVHSGKTRWRHSEKVAIRKPRIEALGGTKPATLWPWTSNLQNREEMHFCCSSHPICCILLQQPNQTKPERKSQLCWKLHLGMFKRFHGTNIKRVFPGIIRAVCRCCRLLVRVTRRGCQNLVQFFIVSSFNSPHGSVWEAELNSTKSTKSFHLWASVLTFVK